MRGGQLRTPLWIQSPVESTNDRDEVVVTGYQTLTMWWAERADVRGAESFEGQQFHGTQTVLFKGRFIPSLTVTTKMVLSTANVTTLTGATRYDIQAAADPDGRRRELQIVALQRAA